jgi:hypothetical protein
MAARKKAAEKEAEAPNDENTAKVMEAHNLESPISTTGASPVFRADLGEALPAQKPAGVE